jgi:SAM-dependent methyltransferase
MARADASSTGNARRYWDEIAAEWTELGRDPVWRAHSDAVNSMLLARWLPANRLRRVLKTDLFDEAVAEGLYPVLESRAERVTGVDLSPVIVESANARYPQLEGIVADVRRLPFGDSEFDCVVSTSTLDHFDSRGEIRQGLLELRRVLSPGAILAITLDNGSNPLVALRNRLPDGLLRGLDLVPYRVGKTCTARRLAALLRSCDFVVEDLTYVLHCPRLPALRAGRVVERRASERTRARFLRLLAGCERLEEWPTRAFTGYFVAALARRR